MKNKKYTCWICFIVAINAAGCEKEKSDENVRVALQVQTDKVERVATPAVLVDSKQGLEDNKGKRIRIFATYYAPRVKGSSYLKCEYANLRISDYSFYKKDEVENTISPMLESGDKVEIEADLEYFRGGKSLVETHPLLQEATPPIELIDGKKYYVYPPNYFIKNGEIIMKYTN
jgi:hypothetical protein